MMEVPDRRYPYELAARAIMESLEHIDPGASKRVPPPLPRAEFDLMVECLQCGSVVVWSTHDGWSSHRPE